MCGVFDLVDLGIVFGFDVCFDGGVVSEYCS